MRRCIFAQLKIHHNGGEKFTFVNIARASCFEEVRRLVKYIIEEVKDEDSFHINRLDHDTHTVCRVYKKDIKRSK